MALVQPLGLAPGWGRWSGVPATGSAVRRPAPAARWGPRELRAPPRVWAREQAWNLPGLAQPLGARAVLGALRWLAAPALMLVHGWQMGCAAIQRHRVLLLQVLVLVRREPLGAWRVLGAPRCLGLARLRGWCRHRPQGLRRQVREQRAARPQAWQRVFS